MRLRLRPQETSFYELFAQSAANLVAGADLLELMLGPSNDKQEIARRMKDVEHRGDEMTHDIVRRVNKTFVTPFDREDIYRLAAGLDDVLDHMEEAVDYVLLYGIESLPSEVGSQVEALKRAARITADSMPRLRAMRDLEDFWVEINSLENQGDAAYRRIVAGLFRGENDALTVLKVKDVVDALEAALDSFEQVANIVEQIAVKES